MYHLIYHNNHSLFAIVYEHSDGTWDYFFKDPAYPAALHWTRDLSSINISQLQHVGSFFQEWVSGTGAVILDSSLNFNKLVSSNPATDYPELFL